MTPTHTIRLRHPWQCESRGDEATWSRKFNWPAELETGEVVWLVVEPATLAERVALNGDTLTTDGAGRFDITVLISQSNRLTISLPSTAESPTCPFDVRLEIVEEKG